MLQVSLLGPLEVRRDGHRIVVPGGRTAELLVRLALDAGTLVRSERLLEDLWADEAVHTRRNTLQSKVARLRRALGDEHVLSGDGGYVLAVDRAEIDALAVMDDVATATRSFSAGDDHAAVDVSATALERFDGELLPAVGDWAAPHRARLDEARRTLTETLFSARLRLGDTGDLVGGLETAVAAYPFQESLWELLITALYRAGRQAEALDAYQRVRRQLADHLGLDPGPRLQDLERQILQHDHAVAPASVPRGNLPSLGTDLVGRASEIEGLRALVAAVRLVVVVGPGGVGKTALAIETGRRIALGDAPPDGVWLVRLEAASTATEVVDAVIAALGVAGGEPALIERLKGGRDVLILDNCEHVADDAALLVVRLLDEAPDLHVLCTSQVPLEVDGEVVVDLDPLPLDAAVELFTRRATQRGRREVGDVAAVEELCRSLDALPLAIELAAARTRTLSVAEISRRLDDRFAVLSDPTSRRPERRRALRSTISWSYELLFPDDKRGLWALATFAAGAPLPAVERVLEALDVPASAAIDVLGRLASRSLLLTDDEHGASRYRLLDSIRAFARDALSDADVADRAFAAHAAWFADEASSSTAGVRSAQQAEHLAFVRVERANVDSALAWTATHEPLAGVAIVNGLGWAWIVLGDSRGAERILAALDAAGDAVPAPDRASALLLAAWIEASIGHIELAHEHITVASALARHIGDVELEARSCYYLAYVVSHEGHWQDALDLTDRSRTLYDDLDRPWDQAANALFATRAAISAGDEARAVGAAEQVDRWLQVVDDPWLHVRRDAMLGELARLQHRFDDAVLHLGRAADTSRRLGFQQTEAYQVSSLGRAQCQAGDYDAGAATLQLAIDKAEATGDVRLAALARVHLGRVLRALGRNDDARSALEAAAVFHRRAGGGEQAALGDCLLAVLDAATGMPDAPDRLEAILRDARRRNDAPVEVFTLDALAVMAAARDEPTVARHLSEEADRRMAVASHFISERDRCDARRLT